MSRSRSGSETSDEETGPYTSGSDSGPLLSAPTVSSSSSVAPQLQSPDSVDLDTLRKKLKRCRKLAIVLQSDLASAYNIAAPGFFKTLFSSAPNPEHKAILAPLLSLIDPHKELGSQLASLIAAEGALTKFLIQLMTSADQKKREDSSFIKRQVDVAYEALFKSFDEEFNRLRKKEKSRQQALSQYCDDAEDAKKQFAWVRESAVEVVRLLNQAATVNAALEAKISEQKEFAFPHNVRDVRPCLEEITDTFDAIKKQYKTLGIEVSDLAAIKFDDLQQQVEAIQKRLGELRKSYEAANEAYHELHGVHFITELQEERPAITGAVNALSRGGEKAFKENGDSIILVMKAFIDDVSNNEARAEAAIDKLFINRGSVVEGFKPQLLALLERATRLEAKTSKFESEISRLDEEYKGLNLEPRLLKVLAGDREKDERVRREKLNSALAIKDIAAIQDKLKAIRTSVESCQEKLAALTSKLSTAKESATRDVTSTLSLIAPTVSLENSESFFNGMLRDLSRQIEGLSEYLGTFEKEEGAVSRVLTRISILQTNWKRYQDLGPVQKSQANLAAQLERLDDSKAAAQKIEEAKEKWDACATQKDKFFNWFSEIRKPAGFELKEAVFNKVIIQVGEALTQLAMAKPGTFAEVDDLELSRHICVNYRALFSALDDAKSYFQKWVPEFSQAKQAYQPRFTIFNTVSGRINAFLDGTREWRTEIESRALTFREYYSKIEWNESSAVVAGKLSEMKKFPGELEAALQDIQANADLLMSETMQDSMQAMLTANLEKFRQKLANYRKERLEALIALQKNLNTYIEKFKRYKVNLHFAEQTLAALALNAAEVRERSEAIKSIIALNAKCCVISDDLQEKHGKINACRSRYFGLLRRELNIVEERKHLEKLFDRIEQEETCKTKVKVLFKNISSVKRVEGALQRERTAIAAMSAQPDKLSECNAKLFRRLRCEFLFSGKSRVLIEELKAHRQLPRHTQSQKGLLIDRFFTQLFDENQATDLRQLLNCLKQPFGANNPDNDALFQYTGIYKLGSHEKDSTTKQLIAGLRKELLALVQRENVSAVGSISHALQLECAQAKREYHAILDSKKLADDSSSMQLAQTCEAHLSTWLAVPQPDATTKKIQQDLIGIQRWAGANGVNMQMRERRMRCAIAIRKNLNDEQNDDELRRLYQEGKFTYTYQSLRCYMERVVTKREREVAVFWQNLDRIAFSSDDEVTKYAKMRESVLSYYRGLRQMKNGSAGYFFGRGSRLGNALEHFLTRPESTDGGFGYVHGNLPNEVRHHHPEVGCFDGIAKKMSETLFCYTRN